MAELFADLPEAIANTAVIAQRCAVGAPKRKPILPRLSDRRGRAASRAMPTPASTRGSRDAARRRRRSYRERLEFEIDVITRMGFAGYFLIVADFIKWAKAQRYPGRARAAARAPARSSPGR